MVHEVRNVLGARKGWGAVTIRANGSTGCTASFSEPEALTGDVIPWEVRKSNEPRGDLRINPNDNCALPPPDSAGQMRCQDTAGIFEVALRLPPAIGPVIYRYDREVRGSLCSDGTTTGNPFQ